MTTLKFYTDKHIAKAVALQLRNRNLDIVRCEEIGKDAASDEEHLIYATAENRVMITADQDFLRLDTEWRQAQKKHAGIMFVPPHLKGKEGVGAIVREIFWYYEAVAGGAATIEQDIANHVIYIR